ncbi:hypothetical protein HYT01_02170 [Candidatus Giovannonibacteria bacterium]|nr:hypothetical protein [Candidatus Giovannonibacteria bacterium]
MKIFRVIGLAMAILVLQFLTPQIWAGFQSALLTFFKVFESTLQNGQAGIPLGR